MRKITFFVAIVIAFTSCRQLHGSGNIVTEKRQLGDFKGIIATSAFEVELKSGPVTSVEVEADDNLVKYIDTRASGGKLRIEFRKSFSLSNAHLKVYVTAPDINSIKCTGAANVKVLDPLKSNGRIMLETSGAGSIVAEVDAPDVETDVSGAGSIKVKGRTKSHTAKASGSGDIKAKELLSENVSANASGAGSIHVFASVRLKAHASGAGNVFYSGAAAVESDTSGAGEVKKED